MTVEIHSIIRGNVQGVGFRATARSLARQLGLVGTVANLDDGSVEIYIQGPSTVIKEFFRLLQGHHFSEQIKDFSLDEQSSQRIYTSFSILP